MFEYNIPEFCNLLLSVSLTSCNRLVLFIAMEAQLPCSEWDRQAQHWYDHMPVEVADTLGRAVRFMLRYDPATAGQWIGHRQLFELLHLTARHAPLKPMHVHAVMVMANRERPKFNIYQVWSKTEPSEFTGFEYRAEPGSYSDEWRRADYGHRKAVSKYLGQYLRKRCTNRMSSIDNIQEVIQSWDHTVTVAMIWDVIENDPGRFTCALANGTFYVTANRAHQYRHPAPNNVRQVDREMNLQR